MGLLGDGFEDPRSQAIMALAGGLLKRDFGGGLLGANQAFADAKQNAFKQRYMDMQMQNMQSEVALRNAQAQKIADGQKWLAARMGQGPTYAPGQMGSGTLGVIANDNPMSSTPTRPGGLAGMTPDEIALAENSYGYKLMEPWKIAKQGFEQKPGMYRVDPSTNQMTYIPNPVDGRTVDPSGRVGLMPGFADATTATTLAQEAPKALLGAAGRVNLRDNPDGTKSPISELSENPTLQNVLGGIFGGRGPAASVGAPGSAPAAPAASMAPPAGRPMVAPADQRGADAESIRMIQAEMQNPNLPPAHRQAMEREVARLTQAQTQPGFPAPSTIRNPQGYGKTTAQEAQERLSTDAGGKINDSWLKNSYEPTLATGGTARDLLETVQVTRQAMNNLGGTGWSTQAKAAGAAILTGLGVAPRNAQLFAANAEVFQKTAMERLWTTLNEAKGPQTEGDAERASKTYASLKNTTKANEFILDFAEAKAQRDQIKAKFYQQALPIARQKGDLSEVDREWSKLAPSIFNMPSLKRWPGGVK